MQLTPSPRYPTGQGPHTLEPYDYNRPILRRRSEASLPRPQSRATIACAAISFASLPRTILLGIREDVCVGAIALTHLPSCLCSARKAWDCSRRCWSDTRQCRSNNSHFRCNRTGRRRRWTSRAYYDTVPADLRSRAGGPLHTHLHPWRRPDSPYRRSPIPEDDK